MAFDFYTERDSGEGGRRGVEEKALSMIGKHRTVHCALSGSSHTEKHVFFKSVRY